MVAIDHAGMIRELGNQFRPILDRSPDGVYVWLDEEHKLCNERLARMFGYTIEEWSAAVPFLETFVAEEDRGLFSWYYQNRVAPLAFPATFPFRGQRKDGATFSAETDMIPIAYQGHAMAYHFVRQTVD